MTGLSLPHQRLPCDRGGQTSDGGPPRTSSSRRTPGERTSGRDGQAQFMVQLWHTSSKEHNKKVHMEQGNGAPAGSRATSRKRQEAGSLTGSLMGPIMDIVKEMLQGMIQEMMKEMRDQIQNEMSKALLGISNSKDFIQHDKDVEKKNLQEGRKEDRPQGQAARGRSRSRNARAKEAPQDTPAKRSRSRTKDRNAKKDFNEDKEKDSWVQVVRGKVQLDGQGDWGRV